MKLETAPFAEAHQVLVEETAFLSYSITHEFNEPAMAIVVLADPTGSISQKYDVDNGAVGGAVADDGGAETDETTEANEDTADDMTLIPAAPAVNDAYYFGFSSTFPSVIINISTPATAVIGYTLTWEYSTGADSWSALAGVTDGTATFTNTGVNRVDWTIPTDWATDTVGAIASLYWVRARISFFNDITQQPLGQQAWIKGTYIGPGRAKIEDPDGTCVFEGRIIKATHQPGYVFLHCVDWLSQLNEDRINYDMREDLDSDDDMGEQGIRESPLHADADNATIIDVAYNDGGGNYYLYDDARSWDVDEFNGKYLVLGSGMAGKNTWRFFPYAATVSDGVTGDGDPELLWTDDSSTAVMFKNADWTVEYHFRVYLGHDDPSNFYVHDSVTGVRFVCNHKMTQLGGTNHAHVNIEEHDGPNWVELDHVIEADAWHRGDHTVLQDTIALGVVDNTGLLNILYDVDRAAGNATMSLTYAYVEIDCETTGYSTAISIIDTLDLNGHGGKVNCLEVGTDMTAAATRVWEGVPYSICKKIKDHINTIVVASDPLFTLDTSIEATDGITTRNYQERTSLEILKDLAEMDKTVFWIALSDHTTPTVTWKRTFNDGGPTELTDASVLEWTSGEYDYTPMINEYHVYGVRIADSRLYVDTGALATDPGVDSKTLFGTTRSAVIKNTGTVSEYECEELGKAMVERDEDVHLYLRATLAGLSSLRLGSEVNINSTLLGLTDQKYVVTHWSYDSIAYRTTIRFHPRQSIGFIKHRMFGEHIKHVIDENKLHKVDKSTPSLHTQTWG